MLTAGGGHADALLPLFIQVDPGPEGPSTGRDTPAPAWRPEKQRKPIYPGHPCT